MGLDVEQALRIMGYEDDDCDEADSFSRDRQYYYNRDRAFTDSKLRPEGLTRRLRSMFGDSESFNDHFPLVRKLMVRPIVAGLVISTSARGASGFPLATVETREDGILFWMGWKSIWAILIALQTVIVTFIVLRHYRLEPVKPSVPEVREIVPGRQDTTERLEPIIEEVADADDDDNWRLIGDENSAESEAPVRLMAVLGTLPEAP